MGLMKEQLLSTDWFLSDLKVLSLSHSFGKSSVNLKNKCTGGQGLMFKEFV